MSQKNGGTHDRKLIWLKKKPEKSLDLIIQRRKLGKCVVLAKDKYSNTFHIAAGTPRKVIGVVGNFEKELQEKVKAITVVRIQGQSLTIPDPGSVKNELMAAVDPHGSGGGIFGNERDREIE